MATIARLNVMLTASAGAFTSTMRGAGQTLGSVQSAFDRLTDSATAWKSLSSNIGQLKLAGRETVQSLQTALAVGRSELRRFMQNADVKVAIDFASEKLTAAWNKAKGFLQSIVDKSHIMAAVHLAEGGTGAVRGWLDRVKASIGRGIHIPLSFATEKFDAAYIAVRLKIEGLRRFRAVRIGLALIDHLRLPAAAAIAALVPLRRLATTGIKVALSASHVGIAAACNAAKSALSGLKSTASSILSGISKAFTGIAVAAGVVGFGVFEMVRHTMESIDATAKLGDRLGITTDKLMGMQYAANVAGVGADQLSDGMGKMLKSIGEAADGTGAASAAFAHLRLDAAKLANLPTDQAFTTIAEKLRGIENPAERAAVTMQIFGRSGQELLPLLMKGADGIAELQKQAEKLGLTMGRTDAAKVELAGESIRRMQGILEGVERTIVVELAPYIEALADKFTELATRGGGVGPVIVNAFGSVVKTVATMSDYLSIVSAGWQMLRSGASFAIGGILDGIGYVLDALDWLLKKLGKTGTGMGDMSHNLAKGFYATGKEAFAQAGQDWNQFANQTNSKAATKAIEDIQNASAKAATKIAADANKLNGAAVSTDNYAKKLETAAENAKKVQESLDTLQKDIATFGMTDAQKRAFDLKGLGATPEQLASAQKMADQLDRMANAKKAADTIADLRKEIGNLNLTEGQKKLADLKLPGVDPKSLETIRQLGEQLDALKEGKQIFDETRSPMEKYESQITKLGDLLGKGAINWDTYGRSVRKARAELEKSAEQKSPDLMQSGSAAAQQYEYQQQHQRAFDFTAGSQKQDAQKNAREEQQYQEVFQSRLILQRIQNTLDTQTATTATTVDFT